jgi:ankyrin repeat protein
VPALRQKLNRNLQLATARGDVGQIQQLLACGAEVNNQESPLKQTPLFIAVHHRRVEVMRLLLKNGANPNTLNGAITPFGLAINQWNDEKVLREFLTRGADPDTRATPAGEPALWEAAFYGHYAVIQELLRHGARADIIDKAGRTPLAEVISNGQMNSALLLLEKGAKPRGKASGFGSIWQFLLAAHRKNNLYGEDCPSTCLHVPVARALLEKGANANEPLSNGRTVLIDAVLTGDPAMVTVLLEHGARVNDVGSQGDTALMVASGEVAPVLLAYRPNLRLKNKRGETALDIALSRYSDDEKLRRVVANAYGVKPRKF